MHSPSARKIVEDWSATFGVDPHNDGKGVLCIQATLVWEQDVAVCDALKIVRTQWEAVRSWSRFNVHKSSSSVAVDTYVSSSSDAIKRVYNSGSCRSSYCNRENVVKKFGCLFSCLINLMVTLSKITSVYCLSFNQGTIGDRKAGSRRAEEPLFRIFYAFLSLNI